MVDDIPSLRYQFGVTWTTTYDVMDYIIASRSFSAAHLDMSDADSQMASDLVA